MPNWCSNTLKVYGTGKEMDKFQKKLDINHEADEYNSSCDKLLSRFIDLPKEIKEVHNGACTIDGNPVKQWLQIDGKNVAIPRKVLDSWMNKYGATNWYHWCINEWGTKWDVDAHVSYCDEDTVELDFDSAWSPPIIWLEKIAKEYLKLVFILKYEEEGNGFVGVAKGKEGIVKDQCIEY